MVSVLLTSVGTDAGVALCRALRDFYGAGIRLVGVDLKPRIACAPLLDDFQQAPQRSSPGYLEFLGRVAAAHGVSHIWPLSTEDQEILARAKDAELQGYGILCSSKHAVRVANDKIQLYDFSKERGLPVPRYHVVDGADTLRQAAFDLGYPAKPVVLKTATGTGAAGLKIIRANVTPEEMFRSRLNRDLTLERAAGQLDAVKPWPRLMVTEFLPGTEFSVDILRHGKQWYGGVVRRRDESLFGLATDATVVDRSDVLELARRVSGALELEYVNNVQFRCSESDAPMLMEINPRVPGTIELSVAAGSNLPAMALELARGKQVTFTPPLEGTQILRYFAGTILTS